MKPLPRNGGRLLIIGVVCLTGCGDPASTANPPIEPEVTWTKDVQPIIASKCQGCHAEGSIGGFPLETFSQVSSIATSVADSVQTGRMPPWFAAQDCNEYKDDFSLTETERQTILDWVDLGAPRGSGAEATVQALESTTTLPRVDLSLTAAEPFVPIEEPDDYRCFPIDWPFSEGTYATGYQVVPDADDIVHHVIAYILPGDYRDQLAALEAEDGRPGYSCFGGPGPVSLQDAAWLGGWAPGSTSGEFPEGTGIRMNAESIVVLQIHYFIGQGEAVADQTRIDIMVDDDVENEAWIQPFTNPFWIFGDQMEIPAGSTDHEESFSYSFRDGATLFSANLHMHLLGQQARLTVDRVDGTEDCLVDVPNYDFDWQRSYRFQEPQVIKGGDTLNLSCFFDNPTDEDVHWGDSTTNEMCLATMYMIESTD